jgi:hypothetical protein
MLAIDHMHKGWVHIYAVSSSASILPMWGLSVVLVFHCVPIGVYVHERGDVHYLGIRWSRR